MTQILYKELTSKILNACFFTHKHLGPGLNENIYQNALTIELLRRKMPFEAQKKIEAKYFGYTVGTFEPDFIIDNKVILEIKTAKALNDNMAAQVINYLKLTKLSVGLLVNFKNRSVTWKRYYNQQE